MIELNKTYWETRWENGETGWDIGHASPALTDYVEQIEDKNIRILIPGCGNAYEAESIFKMGFKNVYVIDIAKGAVSKFRQRFPEFPQDQIILGDFFNLDQTFDLILEQTFFCALNPSLRRDYALKMKELIVPGGRLAGLLFDDPLFQDHPPFGGNKQEYLPYFSDLFEIEVFERAYNSIKPREGRELFFKLRNKL
jgi:SAM-dependent methyltransferase